MRIESIVVGVDRDGNVGRRYQPGGARGHVNHAGNVEAVTFRRAASNSQLQRWEGRTYTDEVTFVQVKPNGTRLPIAASTTKSGGGFAASGCNTVIGTYTHTVSYGGIYHETVYKLNVYENWCRLVNHVDAKGRIKFGWFSDIAPLAEGSVTYQAGNWNTPAWWNVPQDFSWHDTFLWNVKQCIAWACLSGSAWMDITIRGDGSWSWTANGG